MSPTAGHIPGAAARGNHGGRPKVIDHDSLIFARALPDAGTPIPEIVGNFTIKTGKNAGEASSRAWAMWSRVRSRA